MLCECVCSGTPCWVIGFRLSFLLAWRWRISVAISVGFIRRRQRLAKANRNVIGWKGEENSERNSVSMRASELSQMIRHNRS